MDFRSRKHLVLLLTPIVLGGAAAVLLWGEWGLFLAIVLLAVLTLLVVREALNQLAALQADLDIASKRLEATTALYSVLDLKAPLPPLRGAIISPDFACMLVGLLRELRPRNVLELGSGVSTTITAQVLADMGEGHLTSVENEAKYGAITERILASHGLSEWVTIVDAPIRTIALGSRTFPWYDLDLSKVPDGIDLLVVDGPPAMQVPDARYPALPVLHAKLSANAVILVDDCDREGDRSNVREWLAAYPDFELEEYATEKGTAILRRRSEH